MYEARTKKQWIALKPSDYEVLRKYHKHEDYRSVMNLITTITEKEVARIRKKYQ